METLPLVGRTSKTFRHGTHRAISPQETLSRLQPHLAEYGITRLANITGLDNVGIPVALAVRPNARSLSVSQGKGADLVAAKVSALMESIEQHHAEHDRLHVRWAAYDELTGREPVLDPARLPRLNRPYDGRMKTLWTMATELGTGRSQWVPYEAVHLNFTLPLPPGSGYVMGGSNGLASGNNLLEAIVHGLDELIERDALALLYQRSPAEQQRRRLDPATVRDPLCVSLLGKLESAGVAVALWDATSDLGVPTYLCDIIDRDTNVFRPLGASRGSGCHVEPAVALARALTEAAQSRLTRIAGSRDDLRHAEVEAHRAERKIAADRARVLAPAGDETRFDRPSAGLETFEDELGELLARLRGIGVASVLVVDLSPPERPFHVVRVLAPGLEGSSDNPGYQPGPRARAVRQTRDGRPA